LVSVVLPVFNDDMVLERALQSVFAQTEPAGEVIVVDDASDIPAAMAIRGICEAFPKVRLVVNSRNLGAAAARNIGVEAATNPFVAFLDADDEWLPEKLAVQTGEMRATGQAISACAFQLYREGNGSGQGEFRRPKPIRSLSDLVWGCSISPGSGLLLHKSVFETVGGFDPAYRRFEDWDWLIRAARHGYAVHIVGTVLVNVFFRRTPPVENVKASADRIRDTYSKLFLSLGFLSWLKFNSTYHVEIAAACIRNGRFFGAVGATSVAVILWPFRNLAFWRRLVRVSTRILIARIRDITNSLLSR